MNPAGYDFPGISLLPANLVPHLNPANPVGEMETISANLPPHLNFAWATFFDSHVFVIHFVEVR